MQTTSIGRLTARVLGRLVMVVVVGSAVALLLAATVLPAVYAADVAVDSLEQQLFDHPPLPEEIPAAPQVTHVHDMSGERITELHGPVEREPVPLEEISQAAVDAVLATEDARFFEHGGVNHDSIMRAGMRNLTAGGIVEGASTITQQLVTMAFLDPEPTIDRKLREIVWAVELEEQLSKEEILEAYLNRVYLGQGVYGIGTAAEYYFSKPASELSASEAAVLAGAIRAPTRNNPVDNPEAAAARRDVVLRQMVRVGALDEEDAEASMGVPVSIDLREEQAGEPFWEDLVKRVVYDPAVDLQPGLQEAVGASVDARVDALFEGGLRITTTLDRTKHRQAHESILQHVADPVSDPLASLLTVDHRTGAVRALAMGPKAFGHCDEGDEPCTTTQVNPVVPGIGGSGRQSGSSFKPYVAAAALEQGEDTGLEYETPSGEEIEDCGYQEEWEPENFDLRDHGEIDMTEAMRDSTNVYFAKLTRDVGVSEVVDSAIAHGVSRTLDPDGWGEQDCALGLGSADAFPWEMVAGYGAWANGGVVCEPYIIEEIRDRDGEVLYSHEPDCRRATDEVTAATMTELLREPVGPQGTAAVVGQRVPDATGKTGTTNDFRDAWFIGSARGHTTAAWVGFEQPRAMRDITVGDQWYERVTGGAIPAPMWAELVSRFPEE